MNQLRTALANGTELHADESRVNFYDLNSEDRTYFIYISPVSGSVTLIATWARKYPSADAKSDEQTPCGGDGCNESWKPRWGAVYALRKTIVEPVFGQIKQARGFRQFLLRGLAKVRGEWVLICMTHNILKLHKICYG
jgi:hypothetical protein